MSDMQIFIEAILNTKIINSIFIIIIGASIYSGIAYLMKKSLLKDKTKLKISNRGKTYLKFLKSILRYVAIIITAIFVLQANGINVSSLLAGIGIMGAIIGLAIQDWIKDIIRGGSILSDSYFEVGDIVNYKGTEGKVLIIGLKTTKIQDLKTGNIKSIANRNIDEIDVVSNLIYINVPMPYELKIEEAERVIDNIVENIKKNDNVKDCKYVSINEIASSFINYYIQIDCNQLYKLQVKRDALRSILTEMEKNGISVPYTQIDIHNK